MSKNKVALVTGGSTGIGAAVAKQLAAEGFQILITGRTEKTLKQSAAQNKNIAWIKADIANPDDVKRTIEYIKKEYGQLDVLVNNAGIAPPLPLEAITLEHFDEVFGTNVRGLVNVTVNVLPLLKKSKGNIINISSVVGDKPVTGMSIYSATKGAINTLSKGWAKELAEYGIRVNAVSPGPIETPLFNKMEMEEGQKQEMADAITGMVPLRRFGSAEEVAEIVAFLASDRASYITGAQYKVDGGYGA